MCVEGAEVSRLLISAAAVFPPVFRQKVVQNLRRLAGAPAKRVPQPAEALPDGEPAGRYEALLQDETWGIKAAPGEYTVEKDGKLYRALICRNPLQAQKEQGRLNSYDVIRVLA